MTESESVLPRQGLLTRLRPRPAGPVQSTNVLAPIIRALILLVLIVVAMFPVFWYISLSLRPNPETLGKHPTLLPVTWTLDNYLMIFGLNLDTDRTQTLPFKTLASYIRNGVIITGSVTVLAGVFAILAGYSFSRFEFPGKKVLLISILNTQMFPYIAIIVPIYMVYRTLGLVNTHLGLILAEMGLVLPFSIWMMKGFCDTVDRDLEDAAFIEGATSFRVIWRIVVPLIGPGIAAVSIFCFLASWNHMLYVLLLATDNSTITVPYGIMTSYAGVFQYTYGLLAAGIVFTTAPIVLLFLWLQKYYVSGITAGAIKG